MNDRIGFFMVGLLLMNMSLGYILIEEMSTKLNKCQIKISKEITK